VKVTQQPFEFEGWAGETPYFLAINTDEPKASWIVDLDEFAWMSQEPGLMRAESEWLLVAKRDVNTMVGHPVLALRVLPGEQPYYTKKIVGELTSGNELSLYGIGKKRLDGHVDRLWILPNGIIVPGDDGELIATRILKALRQQPQGEGPA
jgi:hypothetical protein